MVRIWQTGITVTLKIEFPVTVVQNEFKDYGRMHRYQLAKAER